VVFEHAGRVATDHSRSDITTERESRSTVGSGILCKRDSRLSDITVGQDDRRSADIVARVCSCSVSRSSESGTGTGHVVFDSVDRRCSVRHGSSSLRLHGRSTHSTDRRWLVSWQSALFPLETSRMSRQGLRPSLSLFRLSLPPESNGYGDSETDDQDGDNDGSGDTSLGDTTRLGRRDIVKDTISRGGGGGRGSVGLDSSTFSDGGEHGGCRVVDGEKGTRRRGGIPNGGTGFHDAKLETSRLGRVPPFRSELDFQRSSLEVDILPCLDECRIGFVEVDVDLGFLERTCGVPFKFDWLGGVEGGTGSGGCVEVTRGEGTRWELGVNR
jgi:hypothetical protein